MPVILRSEYTYTPDHPMNFSQDIDAAYIFDDDCDLDASLSALLEVPSLDFSQFDAPVTTTTHSNANGLGQPQARSTLNVGEPLLLAAF